MQSVPMSPRGRRAPAKRRTVTALTAKLVTGAALVALLASGLVQPAAAQDDDTIVLTAGGSTLTVSPGHADAVSAVAEAHAEPGFAETIAAGARAVADSDCGAFTEASAASAVAIPDAGAATEAEGGAVLSDGLGVGDDAVDESLAVSDPGAFAEQLTAEILAENEALQLIEGDEGDDGASDPVRAEAKNQKDGREVSIRAVEECIEKDKETPDFEEPVYEVPAEVPVVVEVPSTGTGPSAATSLASLLGAASVAAALGAVALRKRDEDDQVVGVTLSTRR
jgi:hypothetical protein